MLPTLLGKNSIYLRSKTIMRPPQIIPSISHSFSTAAGPSTSAPPITTTAATPPQYSSITHHEEEASTSAAAEPFTEEDAVSIIVSTAAATPDFNTIYASERFFFSCPGQSNSIVDSPTITTSSASSSPLPMVDDAPESSAAAAKPQKEVEEEEAVEAVQTYSQDPYKDFMRSMWEMVEAHGLHDVHASWNSLHELLLCYLCLNPKDTHKFIVGAFADLLVTLMAAADAGRDAGGACGCRFNNK